MSGGMMGLSIGIRALKAQQLALDITGHNIANANTEGFSRQRAEMTATLPYTMPSMYSTAGAGQVGTGVDVSKIIRVREDFIDFRFRDVSSSMSDWTQRSKTLKEIETIFAEPSEEGLQKALSNFWSSLQELHNNPENGAVRAAVRESASSLTDVFGNINKQLADYQNALNDSVKNKASEINVISSQIAALNQQISEVVGKGDNPNDLMDKRDLLIDNLSSIVDIQVNFDARAKANITIGGYILVGGNKSSEITCVADPLNNGFLQMRWKDTNEKVIVSGGEIAGIIDGRDKTINNYLNQLDEVAHTLIAEFNNVHSAGYGLNNTTGIMFFDGTDASDIKVSDTIMDPNNGLNSIATAATINSPGDGRNANKLANVLQNAIMKGTTSVIDYWGGIIAQLGIDSQKAEKLAQNHNTLQHQLDQSRKSVSGVSLDEEMANLIKFQTAYNAAAKLLVTQSEMLETLVGIAK